MQRAQNKKERTKAEMRERKKIKRQKTNDNSQAESKTQLHKRCHHQVSQGENKH